MYRISVIICTYNRADILDQTLASWRTLPNTGADVELIVVDNNSTDHTRQVIDSFSPLCPNPMRYVCETTAGLSNARNRGIVESRGDILAFVDDDVYFDPRWLAEILEAFDGHPEIACVGGKSIPEFEIPIPDWITEEMYKSYGSTGSGNQDQLMTFPKHPFGLNMAFRKSVFEKIGPFNPDLGRVGGCLLSNEEVEIFHRVHRAGLLVYYASRAVLYHRIPKERTEKKWLLERNYWQGISDVVSDSIFNQRSNNDVLRKIAGTCRGLIFPNGMTSIIRNVLFYVDFTFENKLRTYKLLGRLRQYVRSFFGK